MGVSGACPALPSCPRDQGPNVKTRDVDPPGDRVVGLYRRSAAEFVSPLITMLRPAGDEIVKHYSIAWDANAPSDDLVVVVNAISAEQPQMRVLVPGDRQEPWSCEVREPAHSRINYVVELRQASEQGVVGSPTSCPIYSPTLNDTVRHEADETPDQAVFSVRHEPERTAWNGFLNRVSQV